MIPEEGRSLEKEMATHSSVPAWTIPRTQEPGGLPSVGSQRVRHEQLYNNNERVIALRSVSLGAGLNVPKQTDEELAVYQLLPRRRSGRICTWSSFSFSSLLSSPSFLLFCLPQATLCFIWGLPWLQPLPRVKANRGRGLRTP